MVHCYSAPSIRANLRHGLIQVLVPHLHLSTRRSPFAAIMGGLFKNRIAGSFRLGACRESVRPLVRFCLSFSTIAHPSLDISHLSLLGLLLSLGLGGICNKSVLGHPSILSKLTLHLCLSISLHLSLHSMRHCLLDLARLLGTHLGSRSACRQETLSCASCCVGLCDLVLGSLGLLASVLTGL